MVARTLAWRRGVVALGWAAVLAGTLEAQGVRILTPSGDQHFDDLQEAVDAAAEGDVLLVAEGLYGDVSIVAKSLSIHAVPGADVVLPGVEVVDLSAEQWVLLDGLRIDAPFAQPGVRLQDDLGAVRLQGCVVEGSEAAVYVGATLGGPAVDVLDCARVALLDCTLRGGVGGAAREEIFGPAGRGCAGLRAQRSTVALYDCSADGGPGGRYDCFDSEYCIYQPGQGGEGVLAVGDPQAPLASTVFVSGSQLQGGDGGTEYFDFFPGPKAHGGDGAVLGVNATLRSLDSAYAGGEANGEQVTGPGTLDALVGAARTLSVARLVPAGAHSPLALEGVAGDVVWLVVTAQPEHLWVPELSGVWLGAYPAFVPHAPLGVVPSGGVANLSLPVAVAPYRSAYRQLVVQGLVGPSAGQQHLLSSARHVLALSPDNGPDCDGNGVSDDFDVVFGGAPDANHNLIPDTCPGG